MIVASAFRNGSHAPGSSAADLDDLGFYLTFLAGVGAVTFAFLYLVLTRSQVFVLEPPVMCVVVGSAALRARRPRRPRRRTGARRATLADAALRGRPGDRRARRLAAGRSAVRLALLDAHGAARPADRGRRSAASCSAGRGIACGVPSRSRTGARPPAASRVARGLRPFASSDAGSSVPAVAFVLMNGVFLLWHVPALYDAALSSPACTTSSTSRSSSPRSCFLGPRARRRAVPRTARAPGAGRYAIGAMLVGWGLAVVIAMAPRRCTRTTRISPDDRWASPRSPTSSSRQESCGCRHRCRGSWSRSSASTAGSTRKAGGEGWMRQLAGEH